MVLISPQVDLSFTNESFVTNAQSDPVLIKKFVQDCSCVNNLFFKGRMEYAMVTLIILKENEFAKKSRLDDLKIIGHQRT